MPPFLLFDKHIRKLRDHCGPLQIYLQCRDAGPGFEPGATTQSHAAHKTTHGYAAPKAIVSRPRKNPNFQYLAMCVYRLTEAGRGRWIRQVCICRSTEVRVEVHFTLCSRQSYSVSTETTLLMFIIFGSETSCR